MLGRLLSSEWLTLSLVLNADVEDKNAEPLSAELLEKPAIHRIGPENRIVATSPVFSRIPFKSRPFVRVFRQRVSDSSFHSFSL